MIRKNNESANKILVKTIRIVERCVGPNPNSTCEKRTLFAERQVTNSNDEFEMTV